MDILCGPGELDIPAIEGIGGSYLYLVHTNANHGGAFVTSRASDALLDEAHAAMADLLNAPSPAEIVFGPYTEYGGLRFALFILAEYAGIVVLSPELQARLLPVLRDNTRLARLNERRYSMVAHPWAQTYQQSNQWAIETLAETRTVPWMGVAPAVVIVATRMSVILSCDGSEARRVVSGFTAGGQPV